MDVESFFNVALKVEDVDDVETAHEELAAAGVDFDFVTEPSTFDDLEIASFTDPSGTRTELLEHR